MKTLSSIRKLLAAGLLVLPLLALNAHAQYTDDLLWNPAVNPLTQGIWNEGASWQDEQMVTYGVAPTSTSPAHFGENNAIPCIINDAELCGRLAMGDGTPPGSVPQSTLIITNGGSLATTVNDYTAIGYNANALLDMETGSSLTIDGHLWIGFLTTSVGTLTMNGGTASVSGQLGLGFAGGSGFVHLNGGTLTLSNFIPGPGASGVAINNTSTLDITGGTLLINNNQTTAVNNYVTAGRITGYGGSGTVNVTFNAGLNQTVVTATSGGSTPPPRQSITSITRSGGNVTITYNTTIGASYHIASTSSLASPATWTSVPGSQTNSVAGTSVSYTFAAGASLQFYKTVSP